MFKEKKTTTENMTFIAIMSAIVVVISLITSFIPMAGAVLGLIIPIIGTLVAIFAKPRFHFIFIVVTIILSFVASLYAIQNVLFFILPPVITGLMFGICLRNRVGPSVAILVSAITQAILNVGIYYLIDVLYETNIITMILELLKLQSRDNITIILGLGILVFALIQFVLSYFIIYPSIERFMTNPISKSVTHLIHVCVAGTAPLAMIGSVFVVPSLSYVFLGISIYSACFLIYDVVCSQKAWKIIYIVLVTIVGFIVFIILSSITEIYPFTLLSFGIVPFLLFFVCIKKKQSE